MSDWITHLVSGNPWTYVGEPVARRLFRGEKGRARLEWAERAVRARGAALIVVGRYIPGGPR